MFFRALGPRTKHFERLFCYSINNVFMYCKIKLTSKTYNQAAHLDLNYFTKTFKCKKSKRYKLKLIITTFTNFSKELFTKALFILHQF